MGYKCWICKDSGIIIYSKLIRGIQYEMAARCLCMEGQQMGSSIPNVNSNFAERLAEENYIRFTGDRP